MSEHDERDRNAKEAVIALRKELGKTQQGFAVEVVKTAVTTVARWETSHPPRGETLIRLAAIADHYKYTRLAQDFRLLYAGDVISKLKTPAIVSVREDEHGFAVFRFDKSYDVRRAITTLSHFLPEGEIVTFTRSESK